jgi:hypothetical protein
MAMMMMMMSHLTTSAAVEKVAEGKRVVVMVMASVRQRLVTAAHAVVGVRRGCAALA